MNAIKELKKYNILGRSGSCFPAALKWEIVKKQKADKKYIICNGSEGEPKNLKDKYILENYSEYVVEGVKTALRTIDKSEAFIYLKKDYYKKFRRKLKRLSRKYPITIFEKKGGYLAGEETAICEVIEGKRPEPRIKPPFPAQAGLWGRPTLVNNLETFYCAGKIIQKEYSDERFYTIAGDAENKGVFKLSKNDTIERILKKTNNYPNFDFFVQAGGGAMGEILLPKELNKKINGIGSIVVFNKKKTDSFKLMKEWINFFLRENCDKCTPCREGIYRINEIVSSKKLDKKTLKDIFFVLQKTSLCPLGENAFKPFETLIKKVVK